MTVRKVLASSVSMRILTSIKSILSGDTFRLSKLIARIRWLQRYRGDRRTGDEAQQWETQMTKASFRGFELAISLLRTLSQVMDVRSRLVSCERYGNDRSSLLRLGPVDEARLRPALIPIRSSRRRP
jgi:hypothetical protein